MSVRRAAAFAIALVRRPRSLAPCGRCAAEEKVDLAAVTRIRDEAFNRSKAQETPGSSRTSWGRALRALPATGGRRSGRSRSSRSGAFRLA